MKKFLITMLPVMAIQCCLAQKIQHKKAEAYFSQYAYTDAARAYEKILVVDTANTGAMKKLVACYQKLNDPAKAEIWLARICKTNTNDIAYWKQYAAVLASNNKYTEALQWYTKYLTQATDPETARLVKAYEQMNSFYRDSSFYSVTPLAFNSAHADFSPVFFGEGLLFCSARPSSKKAATYKWNHSSYIDLYYTKDMRSEPVALNTPVNSPLHEGPATLSANNDTLFFTRNDEAASKTNKGNNVVKLKIYYSIYRNGDWQKPVNFALNSNQHSTGHPAMAPDHTLYFVSDMPGGQGGTDLYRTRLSNGQWSAAENLGPDINTSGNEMFPFIDAQGNLYFSSNKLPGIGGQDVFMAAANGLKFTAPVNMGAPINSSADDFGWIVRKSSGFFSSNRGKDPKDDNLFAVTIDKTQAFAVMAVTATGEHLHDFTIQLSENGQPAEEHHAVERYTKRFDVQSTYRITCSKEGYRPSEVTVSEKELRRHTATQVINITLARAMEKIAFTTVSADDGQKPLPHTAIQLKNLASDEVISLTSDVNGTVVAELPSGQAYGLVASKVNYKNKTATLDAGLLKGSSPGMPFIIALSPATTLFENNEVGQIIEMDIRYDVNKATIRKDAAQELDRLVIFLRKNPTVKVELGSHTDSRGSQEANLALSQKRAASSAQYITSKGIESKRIIPVGYGEDDLKISAATSEDEHQQNRRTTVKIVGL